MNTKILAIFSALYMQDTTAHISISCMYSPHPHFMYTPIKISSFKNLIKNNLLKNSDLALHAWNPVSTMQNLIP